MKHIFPADLVETEPKTKQDIFDLVMRHYRGQPRRCPPEGQCLYRWGDERCFVGALIDARWRPTMEGYSVRQLEHLFALPTWFLTHLDVIEELQAIHDNEANWAPGVMDVVLKRFADERGLRIRG